MSIITPQQAQTELTSEGKASTTLFVQCTQLCSSKKLQPFLRMLLCFLSACDVTQKPFTHFWPFSIDCGAAAGPGKQNRANATHKSEAKAEEALSAGGLTAKQKPTSIAEPY